METTGSSNAQHPEPELSEFGPAIDWLMSIGGVSSPRLAGLFRTSAENIRRIKYFEQRQLEPSLITFVPELDLVPSTAMHSGVGIRSHRDILVNSDRASMTTDELTEAIDKIAAEHQQEYQFLSGAKRLAKLKQRLGHVGAARRLSLAGLLEQKMSWFLVHSGHSRSAISHASRALWFFQTAYYRKGDARDVREFIKAALIASQANLLAGRPVAALQVLDFVRDAAERIAAPLGSDYHRQRGVAFFQMGQRQDEDARRCFRSSEQQMRRLGEGNHAQALMTGSRHIQLLLKPNWEGSLEVADTAGNTFPAESLEVSMSRHWAAACGFLTDDARVRQSALEKVVKNQALARRFGHQATISKLLIITPELGLPRGLEAVWLRKALYHNAYRFK